LNELEKIKNSLLLLLLLLDLNESSSGFANELLEEQNRKEKFSVSEEEEEEARGSVQVRFVFDFVFEIFCSVLFGEKTSFRGTVDIFRVSINKTMRRISRPFFEVTLI